MGDSKGTGRLDRHGVLSGAGVGIVLGKSGDWEQGGWIGAGGPGRGQLGDKEQGAGSGRGQIRGRDQAAWGGTAFPTRPSIQFCNPNVAIGTKSLPTPEPDHLRGLEVTHCREDSRFNVPSKGICTLASRQPSGKEPPYMTC